MLQGVCLLFSFHLFFHLVTLTWKKCEVKGEKPVGRSHHTFTAHHDKVKASIPPYFEWQVGEPARNPGGVSGFHPSHWSACSDSTSFPLLSLAPVFLLSSHSPAPFLPEDRGKTKIYPGKDPILPPGLPIPVEGRRKRAHRSTLRGEGRRREGAGLPWLLPTLHPLALYGAKEAFAHLAWGGGWWFPSASWKIEPRHQFAAAIASSHFISIGPLGLSPVALNPPLCETPSPMFLLFLKKMFLFLQKPIF